MPKPFKDLMKQPSGYYDFYEVTTTYQKVMTSAKSYAVRAKVKIKTEKYRCMTVNNDVIKTLVRITII